MRNTRRRKRRPKRRRGSLPRVSAIPHTTRPAWPAIRAGRFASTIASDSHEGCRVCLLGLPDDVGVGLNNGRPGARNGPLAFREALATYGTTFDLVRDRTIATRVFDAGDIVPADGSDADTLRKTHVRVTEAVRAIHDLGMLPVCIGGGHDLTFPAVRALSQHIGGAVGGLNLDAHLDVRAEVGSGMPFRALIDGGFLDPRHFAVVGAARFAHTLEHAHWLTERGGTILDIDTVLAQPRAIAEGFKRLASGAAPDAPVFVTIDLDAIDGSQAPGVSAVNPMGVSVQQAVEVARRAGANPNVKHFDIMELNPDFDDGRTARIAALLFLTFIAGCEDRWA